MALVDRIGSKFKTLTPPPAHMALTVADNFYLLEQGKVTFEGAPGALEEDEVIRRAYLGSQQD